MSGDRRDKPLEKLWSFYQRVDSLAERLEQIHAERLNCKKGCSACCVDGITVFEIEAENIRRRHAPLLEEEMPHPEGMCAFLDQSGACRIYPDRPYVCRTQGLPLRWFERIGAELAELRDICPLNEEGEPIEDLPADACWTIGEFEASLARLEKEFENAAGGGGEEKERIRLRDLFVRPSASIRKS